MRRYSGRHAAPRHRASRALLHGAIPVGSAAALLVSMSGSLGAATASATVASASATAATQFVTPASVVAVQAEIARDMGVSVSSVEKYILEALKHCREHLIP